MLEGWPSSPLPTGRQLSPLHVPVTRKWIVPEITRWIAGMEMPPMLFVEPFCGAGEASLAMVMDGVAFRAYMADADPGLGMLWRCIFDDASWLMHRIMAFVPDNDLLDEILDGDDTDFRESAFRRLLSDTIGGLTGHDRLEAAWSLTTAAERIAHVYHHREYLEFANDDGILAMQRHASNPNAAFFIAPPDDVDYYPILATAGALTGPFMAVLPNTVHAIDSALRCGMEVEMVEACGHDHLLVTPVVAGN